jgi:hypothetical protein
MIVTEWELAGLNTISGGGALPGLELPSGEPPNMDALLDGLKRKEVIGPDGHLSAFGMIPVRVVEQYRTADEHVFLNQMRVSRNDDGSLTVLHPAPDGGWGLSRMAPVAVMVALLEAYPFLCQASPGDDKPGPWWPMTLDEWASALTDDGTAAQFLVVRRSGKRVGDGVPTVDAELDDPSEDAGEPVVYGAPGGQGLVYDVTKRKGRIMSVRDIRVHLAELLGCDMSAADGAMAARTGTDSKEVSHG